MHNTLSIWLKINLTLLCLLISHLAFSETNEQSKHSQDIEISDAWIRAVPPVSKMSAVYMTIKNNSSKSDSLLAVDSSIAKIIELHHVRHQNDMMEMYQVTQIDIPSNSTIDLKPGSYHIMLIGLENPLVEEQQMLFTLHFKEAGLINVYIPVKRGMHTMKHH